MTQGKLAAFELTHKAVDSQLDKDTHYFVNRRGFWWISGDQELTLRADIAEAALLEALEVCRMYLKK